MHAKAAAITGAGSGLGREIALGLAEKGSSMSDNIYSISEIVGSSTEGIDDAIRGAIARASKTLHNLDWFEVTDMRRPRHHRRPGRGHDDRHRHRPVHGDAPRAGGRAFTGQRRRGQPRRGSRGR